MRIVTARKRSLEQGNIFTPVCHSVHRGGLPPCMLGYHPPGPCTPLDHTPLGLCTPRDHAPSGPCPPGPCSPSGAEHAERYGQCVGGTHPTGMQSCCIFVRIPPVLNLRFTFSTGNMFLRKIPFFRKQVNC